MIKLVKKKQNMKISLIEFSVENFKIFKNKVTFSTVGRKGFHTFSNSGENLYKTSLIYGPNATGKSTLFEALVVMEGMLFNSATTQVATPLPYNKFLFVEGKDKPIFFEVIFSLENKVFKYNFSFLKDRITEENLFEILANGKEKDYLIRSEELIVLSNDLAKSGEIRDKTRKDVLFLSAASLWNNDLAMKIVSAFKKGINIIQGQESDGYASYTEKKFKEDPVFKNKILDFLKRADFCIVDGMAEKIRVPDEFKKQMISVVGPKGVPDFADTIAFFHKKFNSKGNEVGLEKLNKGQESIGTQRFFNILGPIIDTVDQGKVLIIDEFDSSLHPLLTKFILDIFENQNPNEAQLIVTTHDTSLISSKDDFDRGQIWFTEKDKYGVGNLFSLVEFKENLRNDTEFSKKYLEGRFGALPFIEFNEKRTRE